jgi:hypothetical protein
MRSRKRTDVVITATVSAIVREGAVAKGVKPFAVTYPLPECYSKQLRHGQSITFTLENWKDDIPLETGQRVELRGVRLFDGGWRALSARPIMLTGKTAVEGEGR